MDVAQWVLNSCCMWRCELGLNPYFNGCSPMGNKEYSFAIVNIVLILILMDVAQWAIARRDDSGVYYSLNPYFNGCSPMGHSLKLA